MNYQHPLLEWPDTIATQEPTFRFDQLPQHIRTCVYNHLIPKFFVFRGSRASDVQEWPKSPIANFLACNSDLHALSSEVDSWLYSKSRFEFHDPRRAHGCGQTQVKGHEAAKEFFDCIGPLKLSYITQIYCEFTWFLRNSSIETFSQMLSSLAASDPPRDLKNLDLIFEKVNDVVPAGQKPQMQCFALRGFIGLDLNIVLRTKARLTAKEMNEWRPRYDETKEELPRVDFTTRLPFEVRRMIYRHLIPKTSLIGPTIGTRNIESRSSSGLGILGLLLSSSQSYSEICTFRYEECKFELRATTLWDHIPQVDWVRSFFQNAGPFALHIRHVKIVLNIYGRTFTHWTASILPIITALNQHCSFRFATPIQFLDFEMGFNNEINKFCARWKAVTRAGTEFIVEIQVRDPRQWPIVVTDSYLTDLVHEVMTASLRGFETCIGRDGEVHTRRVQEDMEPELTVMGDL